MNVVNLLHSVFISVVRIETGCFWSFLCRILHLIGQRGFLALPYWSGDFREDKIHSPLLIGQKRWWNLLQGTLLPPIMHYFCGENQSAETSTPNGILVSATWFSPSKHCIMGGQRLPCSKFHHMFCPSRRGLCMLFFLESSAHTWPLFLPHNPLP